MRVILAFLLAFSACARAQSYFKGQAARIVIGQPTFTAQASGPSAKIIGAAAGVAYANGMLFVADSNHLGATPGNHRVLIYLTLPQELPPPTAVLEQESTRCNVCFGTADVVLGQPDFETTELNPPSQTTLREPTAVASDGKILAVADTDNNRVLLWKSIPTTNGAPADVVVGQPDFNSNAVSDSGDPRVPTARSLRGPQGVWLQDGKLFVADTVNNRILIWNQIPTQNQQAADMVLGQPDFGTVAVGSNLSQAFNPQATTLRSPVSVTSDGHRLYVADLGYQRVLIWNSIPTSNQQAADVVVGQPDMTSALPNHVARLCRPVADSDPGSPVYPSLCEATLAFPRFALSDGQRLYISDGGNDRVLVYNEIPTRNGARSDAVLGQLEPTLNQSSDNAFPLRRSAPDTMRTPCGLAHDGTNLYVTDPFDRRVLVFSEGQSDIPYSGIRNAASRQIFAVGSVLYGGTIEKDIDLTITIDETDYTYKTVENDSFANIVTKLSEQINA